MRTSYKLLGHPAKWSHGHAGRPASRIALGLIAVVSCASLLLLNPDSASAGIDGTIEQVIPISAGGTNWSATWTATSATYSPTDDSMGLALWDSTKYDGTVTVYFEAVFSSSVATAGNSTVGLFASGNTTTPVATVTNPANTSVTNRG